jgi:hypothetical protein
MSLPMIRLLPERFTWLMSLYEDNHLKLLRLLPKLRRIEGVWCSNIAGSAPLYCRIIAQEKHTTILLLTHRFETEASVCDPAFAAQNATADDPMAYVRVYHDTRQAEVTHLREGKALRELFRADREIQNLANHRLRLNIFFAKWLDFVANCGHGEGGFERVNHRRHDPAPTPLALRIAELTAPPLPD